MANENFITNIKTHRNYFIVIVIIAIFFSFRECKHQKNVDELVNNISNYSDNAKYYKGKNGEVVAYNSVLKVQNEDQLRSLVSTNQQIRDEIKNFKSIKDVTVIKDKVFIH